MNAVMSGHSQPQLQPYGVGIAPSPNEGMNNLPGTSNYGSVNANANANANANTNANTNEGTATNGIGNDNNNTNDTNPNNNLGPDNHGERRSGGSSSSSSNNNNNNNNNHGNEVLEGSNDVRHPSVSTTSSPPEYVHVQSPSHRPQVMVSPTPQQRQFPLPSEPQSHRSLSSADPLERQISPHPMMSVPMAPQSPAASYGPATNRPPFGLGVPGAPIGNPHPLFHDPETSSHPWSIGSTDGSYALIHLQQQLQIQQQNHQHEELQRRQALAVAAAAAAESHTANDANGVPADDAQPGPSGFPVGPPAGPPAGSGGTGGGPAIAVAPVGSGDGGDPGIKTTAPTTKNTRPTGGMAAAQPSAMAMAQASIQQLAAVVRSGRSLYHDKLFHQSSSSVEGVLSASCDVMGFDIAEMWLRTGPKTHQLTNSHLRPTALQDSVRQDLVDVYYGERSNERTHRLSPALCKRAKDANDVVWVTAHTQTGVEALRMSISNVRTAVAVPICHETSNTNVTIIYFSIRRIVLRPAAVEFLVHMSLSAAVTSVNALSTDGLLDRVDIPDSNNAGVPNHSAHADLHRNSALSKTTDGRRSKSDVHAHRPPSAVIRHQRVDKTSITGARLDLQWRQLHNVEYLTDGGNSWIHTAVYDGKPVVVKTLRPECQDTALAINEIESEVGVHSRVNHPNIVSLIGAGWTSKKVRFIVLERLDGGTLTQMLGYDTRIRDRRRRFWRKKQLPYLDVLRCARSLVCAMQYCHEQAIPGSMVLHRDLKPDNIGFTLDGKVKLIDFGLARILEKSDPTSKERYEMSGETGSLRYMAPEVAEGLSYNHKADVYSFGIIFWEMNAGKRPFAGLSRDSFYEQVVYGGGRPHLSRKWPSELNKLISDCWNVDVDVRPNFGEIVDKIDDLMANEKGGSGGHAGSKGGSAKMVVKRVAGIIDRHSTWF